MTQHMHGDGRRGAGALRAALALAALPPDQLWIDYLAMGGELSRAGLDAAIAGRRPLPDREFERLATALNDEFMARGLDYRVQY